MLLLLSCAIATYSVDYENVYGKKAYVFHVEQWKQQMLYMKMKIWNSQLHVTIAIDSSFSSWR